MSQWADMPFADLLVETKDGEWGESTETVGHQLCEVIRGTDFAELHAANKVLPLRWIADNLVDRKRLQPGDILLETAGGTAKQSTGRTALLGDKFFEQRLCPTLCSSFARHLRLDQRRCDPAFLYYLLQALYAAGYMGVFNLQHTGISRFQFTSFKNKTKLSMPPKTTQKKIAAILSAYDDLIANNQRRIALLESMAEEIYREWFVRMRFPGHERVSRLKGIPSTWRIARLGEIFQTTSGGTPSRGKAENFDGEIPWVKTGELKSLFVHETEERLTQRGIDSSAARVLPRHTVVMAMYCAMPDVTLLGVPAATNQACCALLPREGYLGHTYCYYFAKYALSQMIGFAHGAAQQNLSQEIIRKFQVLHPDPALISLYSGRTSPLFGQAEALMRANSGLKRTRDALLPRLISGKLKVDHLDIQLPPSMREQVTA